LAHNQYPVDYYWPQADGQLKRYICRTFRLLFGNPEKVKGQQLLSETLTLPSNTNRTRLSQQPK